MSKDGSFHEIHLFGMTPTPDGGHVEYWLEEVRHTPNSFGVRCEWWFHRGDEYVVLMTETPDDPDGWHEATKHEAADMAHKIMEEQA